MCKKLLVKFLLAHGTYTSSEALQEEEKQLHTIHMCRENKFMPGNTLIGHPVAVCSVQQCK